MTVSDRSLGEITSQCYKGCELTPLEYILEKGYEKTNEPAMYLCTLENKKYPRHVLTSLVSARFSNKKFY
jgi:hypothetical protein